MALSITRAPLRAAGAPARARASVRSDAEALDDDALARRHAAAKAPHASMLAPFTREDLAPVPPGWRVGPPDFVGLGCGRAGSTWLWEMLQSHPALHASRLPHKELHYFCHFGWQGPSADEIALYCEAFCRPEGALAGDGSFNYLYHPFAVQHLWGAAPEAKLLVILRDPLERFVSQLDMLLGNRLAWLAPDRAREALLRDYSLAYEALGASRLAAGLRATFARWPRERVLVLQHERCTRDPLAELARTFRFLGVDDAHRPAEPRRRVNERARLLAPPDAAARARIVELLEEDVEEVLALCPEIDPSLWPEFACCAPRARASVVGPRAPAR